MLAGLESVLKDVVRVRMLAFFYNYNSLLAN